MKRFLSFTIAVLLIFSLCACRNSNEPSIENRPSDFVPVTGNNSPSDTTVTAVEESAQTVPAEKETVVDATDITEPAPNKITPMVIFGNKDSSTQSGYAALEKIEYTVTDAQNSRNLSVKKICHSHGPASDGQPHYTVVAFQDTFDKYFALTLDRKSSEKVLYLTFDCGWEYENLTSSVLDTLKEKSVPAAFFCTLDHIKKQPELIIRMINEGHIVGNHSSTHPSFAEIDRTKMVKEIEDTENYLRENFGYCAKYFRFPAGEYNENALDLVSSLGYMSVFWSVAYDDWNVNETKGKDYAVKTVTQRLHDGAVILLHSVSADNAAALGEIIDTARAQGYQFKALTDYN